MEKRFALAGNPNCGKTTLFNALTGATARTGNWPGVTVDKREGVYKKLNEPIHIVDLPGIYSLSPYTPEEVISRNFILDEKPDCVINIVDATNIERNLYLTTQLLEIDVPVIIALNMADVVKKEGNILNVQELIDHLQVPVIEISALKEENIDILMQEAYKASLKERKGFSIIENKDLSHLISDIKIAFNAKNVKDPLFHAVKLVELDSLETKNHPELVSLVDEYKESHKDETFGTDFEAFITDQRYSYIGKHFSRIVLTQDGRENAQTPKETLSDKIDKVLTHKIWSIPILIVIMFLMFHIAFSEDLFFMNALFGLEIKGGAVFFFAPFLEGPAEPLAGVPSLGVWLMNWFGFGVDSLATGLSNIMPEAWYTSLLIDGVIGGVGAVLSFIPQILIIFLFIALLEDSGYMARVAYVLDRYFRKFGLSGKAFIPMLTGFGCSVPAVMATRTLETEKEKNVVIRLMTSFSCGAKAPIWALLGGVFATALSVPGDIFVFSIYLIGILCAIIFAIFMKLFSKDQYVSPFIMELPSYRRPSLRTTVARLWEKLKHYLAKAATIIAASTIVIWFLSNFNWNLGLGMVEIDQSILADIGRGLSYIYYPLGWGASNPDGWKYTVGTITGLIAKEELVSTLEVLGLTEANIALNGAAIYSFALYNLFTIPCFAAVGAAYGEQKGKQFFITLGFWFVISYIVALLVYWVGELYLVAWWAGMLVTIALAGLVVGAAILAIFKNKKNSNLMKA